MDNVIDTWMTCKSNRQITDRQNDRWMDKQTDIQNNKWMDKQTDGRTNRQTDRWMDRQTDGQTDKLTSLSFSSRCLCNCNLSECFFLSLSNWSPVLIHSAILSSTLRNNSSIELI